MKNKMVVLKDRMQIKVDGVIRRTITVGTAVGFYEEMSQPIPKDCGIWAWANLGCGIISSNYPDKDRDMAIEYNNYENAPLIKNGDKVLIEGKICVAKVLGNYSTCVEFYPTK